MDFSNKIVALTAVLTDELGQGCAKDFARHGARVLLFDRDGEALRALCADIKAEGGLAVAYEVDPTSLESLAAAAEACAVAWGRVDALITCPMDVEVASIETGSMESWRRVFENNLMGPVAAAKAFLPLLRNANEAAIVHLGSIDGILGNPHVPSYSASKGALVALTHVMAEEFGGLGIRVNCVARAMSTARGAPIPATFEPLFQHTPLGRAGLFDEVGAAMRFLASPASSYITGVVLPVDGGRSVVTPGTRPKRARG